MSGEVLTETEVDSFYKKVSAMRNDDYIVIGTQMIVRPPFVLAVLNKLKRAELRIKELERAPKA